MNAKLYVLLAAGILVVTTKEQEWEYGTAGQDDTPARRHKKKGNVQFVLWKAGQQGHLQDYWHDFDQSWWPTFKRPNG